ncbi:Ldh family oxidoreductase [Neorhizobium petrolearium]|uniref:Ldh family oxidoreductase n=1 Tax=Neorhizobium petrolearium TaxID=515361 RepID=A0ABY8M3J6_9HYPH|nr:Ldh family oxidoreductase [Neorhizobium petrolearium]MCC2613185.1 Ldh family oxidoreductase [Neorhizobium petrolearium]WGI68276.1 Ldh family oxidoreductase [Neorhizobium petrolearium]
MHMTLEETEALVKSVFEANGVLTETARSVARALVHAEAAGQYGHGLRRIPAYIGQARSGKVDGKARPVATRPRPAVLSVDAALGYAYPAFDLAVAELPAIARKQGVALGLVHRSHHAGVMALTVERFAELDLVALMFANAPASMAAWGGRKRLFGTNPIAFAAPVAGEDPLVIDLALSTVAAGKIMAAKQKGVDIPEGWAFDREGRPTTDPNEALKGLMAPSGGAKGAALALMVEILAAGLTGSNFSYEASSFMEEKGTPPSVGQMLIVIDPSAGAGSAAERIAELAREMTAEEGVRLPGRRGQTSRRTAIEQGLDIDDELIASIRALT